MPPPGECSEPLLEGCPRQQQGDLAVGRGADGM